MDVPQTELIRFDSETTPWEDLPSDGCLGFVFYYSSVGGDGRHLRWELSAYDWYFKADGMNGPVYGSDVDQRELDRPSDIRSRYTGATLVRGIWTDEETIRIVQDEMHGSVTCP